MAGQRDVLGNLEPFARPQARQRGLRGSDDALRQRRIDLRRLYRRRDDAEWLESLDPRFDRRHAHPDALQALRLAVAGIANHVARPVEPIERHDPDAGLCSQLVVPALQERREREPFTLLVIGDDEGAFDDGEFGDAERRHERSRGVGDHRLALAGLLERVVGGPQLA